jgi:hypothetical protein
MTHGIRIIALILVLLLGLILRANAHQIPVTGCTHAPRISTPMSAVIAGVVINAWITNTV